jgi:hypothetical protein
LFHVLDQAALPEFTKWLAALPDPAVRGVVIANIKRAKSLAVLLD